MPYARACEKQVISCILVADGVKTEQKAEDLLEVEPLVCRVRVMVVRACLGVSSRCLSGVLRSLLTILAHPPQ